MILITTNKAAPAGDAVLAMLDAARPPKLRDLVEFATQEIIIPEGQYRGRRFKIERQPYTGLYLAAASDPRWRVVNACGPSQSGKTLVSWVVPILYQLFEMRTNVVAGVPSEEIVKDKWQDDLLPAIRSTRYVDLLPLRGAASRDGEKVLTVRFRHGCTIKFMTRGGSDKKRAAFTAPCAAITETDGFAKPGAASVEADPVAQIMARTRAYGDRRRHYAECTLTTSAGRTWQWHQSGTCSRIVCPCPHCSEWVTPGREDLVGWQDATNVIEARDGARFICPACKAPLTDEQRVDMNCAAQLCHRGQQVVDGRVAGDMPPTRTLSVHWTGWNNLFVTAADLAEDEYNGRENPDNENAERELDQFVWGRPHDPDLVDVVPLTPATVMARGERLPRGVVPATCRQLTVGVDVKKFMLHYVVIAWCEIEGTDGEPCMVAHVVDYGVVDTAADDLATERAILLCLRELHELCQAGWPQHGQQHQRVPDQVLIDSGWTPEPIYRFCVEVLEAGGWRYRPAKGFGQSQREPGARRYALPKKASRAQPFIGLEYDVTILPEQRVQLVRVNADFWKLWMHERLKQPTGAAGSMSIYKAPKNEHRSFANHLCAEHLEEQYEPGKGVSYRWRTRSRQNHYLDASYLACVAGHMAGARIERQPAPVAAPKPEKKRSMFLADGQPFLATERG